MIMPYFLLAFRNKTLICQVIPSEQMNFGNWTSTSKSEKRKQEETKEKKSIHWGEGSKL